MTTPFLLRLSPPIIFTGAAMATVFRFAMVGPYAASVERSYVENCRNNWWVDALFIGNFVSPPVSTSSWGKALVMTGLFFFFSFLCDGYVFIVTFIPLRFSYFFLFFSFMVILFSYWFIFSISSFSACYFSFLFLFVLLFFSLAFSVFIYSFFHLTFPFLFHVLSYFFPPFARVIIGINTEPPRLSSDLHES